MVLLRSRAVCKPPSHVPSREREPNIFPLFHILRPVLSLQSTPASASPFQRCVLDLSRLQQHLPAITTQISAPPVHSSTQRPCRICSIAPLLALSVFAGLFWYLGFSRHALFLTSFLLSLLWRRIQQFSNWHWIQIICSRVFLNWLLIGSPIHGYKLLLFCSLSKMTWRPVPAYSSSFELDSSSVDDSCSDL